MKSNLMWIDVQGDEVYVRSGPKMPKEHWGGVSTLLFSHAPHYERAEFERWSGVTLPKGDGIYGLKVQMAVIHRLRDVVETEYVTTKKIKTTLVAEK